LKAKPSKRAAPKQKSAGKKKLPAPRKTTRRPVPQAFPIVGIGTSAGGLAALEKFFRAMPFGTGMGFVVIQHLDPNHKSMLPELLQRTTTMPVATAAQGMPVRPNCVYVIPPNRDITIKDGALRLSKPAKNTRGLHLPIDRFFTTLAANSMQLGIGVILSGMGMDGTRGCADIRARGGFVAAQDPQDAEFDSMPRSVIDTKRTDVVAPVDALPEKILARHQDIIESGISTSAEMDAVVRGDMGKLITLLRVRTGHDFSLYKKATLQRRIERRLHVHRLESIERYVEFLRENPQEMDLLFKEMLIGVTNFFRDPLAWAYLRDHVIPKLLKRHPQGRVLRAWVAGCSTGEEAYSLAIAFRQALAKEKLTGSYTLQIFATDLDPDAIEIARAGVYPASIAADVGVERLSRYFSEEGGRYRIHGEIREMVTFAVQDVVHDPAFTRLDMLFCRNLFIYFETELQRKVLSLFHYSLNPAGVLFLGHAETVGHSTNLFAQVKNKLPFYERQQGHSTSPMEFPSSHLRMLSGTVDPPRPAVKLQTLAEQLLLARYSPTAVLVNGDGDILYISGRTGEYLEPAAGKANWNLHVMVREDLRDEVSSLLNKALRQKGDFSCNVTRRGRKGRNLSVKIAIFYLRQPMELRGMVLITFVPSDVAMVVEKRPLPKLTGRRSVELEEALRHAHEENRSIRESVSTTQEELKSANEELQSTNEELQSTNEELTTSKEEMQSMNEELGTVNAELQSRVDELTRASSDMKNLLDSTEIIAIFLDSKFRVRLFTDSATRVFRLIAGDVGRPLGDIVTELTYPDLQKDATQVLRTLAFSDKQVSAGNRRYRVRIMPYRTLDNVIDGVVITCTNPGSEISQDEAPPEIQ
jgi:chemotaxis methyl-accepting protein methylase